MIDEKTLESMLAAFNRYMPPDRIADFVPGLVNEVRMLRSALKKIRLSSKYWLIKKVDVARIDGIAKKALGVAD